MKKKNSLQTLPTVKKVLKYLKHYKALFAISLILALVIVASTLYIPILVGEAIDLAVDKGLVDVGGIMRIIAKIGIIAAVTALLQWVMNVINTVLMLLSMLGIIIDPTTKSISDSERALQYSEPN